MAKNKVCPGPEGGDKKISGTFEMEGCFEICVENKDVWGNIIFSL